MTAPITAASGVSDAEAGTAVETFDFDAEFQTKIAALVLRDDEFLRRTSHLLNPDFFENVGEAALVNLALNHFNKYGSAPDAVSLVNSIRDGAANRSIRKDVLPMVVSARKEVLVADLSNRAYIEDKVVQFARHQATAKAILSSVDFLNSGKFDEIEVAIQAAMSIGINEDGSAYDYFAKASERTVLRMEKLSGKKPPQGITTGILKLDDLLYHRGWGRKELATILGGPKSGKTTALINFAKSASLAGHNVLYATLEVGAGIISDRLDASIAGVLMRELDGKAHAIAATVTALEAKAGKLVLHEYGSGTLSPNMLRKLIQRYKSPGRNSDGSIRPPIKFDLVVVDYADIMAPNFRYNDTIENSKSIYVDLRAIAFEENLAMLTATQTNREGHKSTVAKAEHVADDFNKVRTVDLMISINKTEEEAARNEARLFFTASRNQESGFTVVIKQNIAMMRFIESVLRVE